MEKFYTEKETTTQDKSQKEKEEKTTHRNHISGTV